MGFKHQSHVSCLPTRSSSSGIEILFVSSRQHKGLFTLPGGKPKPKEKLLVAAARELREEAGVIGQATFPNHPIYFETKSKNLQYKRVCFIYEITHEYDDWDEHSRRERLWIPLNEITDTDMRFSRKTQKFLQLAKQHPYFLNISKSDNIVYRLIKSLNILSRFPLLNSSR